MLQNDNPKKQNDHYMALLIIKSLTNDNPKKQNDYYMALLIIEISTIVLDDKYRFKKMVICCSAY